MAAKEYIYKETGGPRLAVIVYGDGNCQKRNADTVGFVNFATCENIIDAVNSSLYPHQLYKRTLIGFLYT